MKRSLILGLALYSCAPAQDRGADSQLKDIGSATLSEQAWFTAVNAQFDPNDIDAKVVMMSNGTGALIDVNGYFLTNNHIVRDCLSRKLQDEKLKNFKVEPKEAQFPTQYFWQTAGIDGNVNCGGTESYVGIRNGQPVPADAAARIEECEKSQGETYQALSPWLQPGAQQVCQVIAKLRETLPADSCNDLDYIDSILTASVPCESLSPEEQGSFLSSLMYHGTKRSLMRVMGYDVYDYEVVSYFQHWYSVGYDANTLYQFRDAFDVVLAKIVGLDKPVEKFFNLSEGVSYYQQPGLFGVDGTAMTSGFGTPKYPAEVLEAQAKLLGRPLSNFNGLLTPSFSTGKIKKMLVSGNLQSFSTVGDTSGSFYTQADGYDISAHHEVLDSSKGNSGSPVFTNEANPRLMGILYGGRENDDTGISIDKSVVSTLRIKDHYFKVNQPENAEDAMDLSDDIRKPDDQLNRLLGFDLFLKQERVYQDF